MDSSFWLSEYHYIKSKVNVSLHLISKNIIAEIEALKEHVLKMH